MVTDTKMADCMGLLYKMGSEKISLNNEFYYVIKYII